MIARGIKNIVKAVLQTEGQGVSIQRSIGLKTSKMFNPFLLLDHFKSNTNSGFPEHPHKGQETITVLLKGAIAHEDFTGNKGMLYPGDVQCMTAGRGIVHSEMLIPKNDEQVMGLQLWVDLPQDFKEVEPSYRCFREWEIPEAIEQDGGLKVKVISGKAYGIESNHQLAYNPIEYYLFSLKPRTKFQQQVNQKYSYFLYVIEGSKLKIGEAELSRYDNAFFNDDVDDGNTITGENIGDDDISFALVGGAKINQKILHYGPFVGTTNEYLQLAINEYNTSTGSFSNRKSWKTMISNGVTDDMINGPLQGSLSDREQAKQDYLAKK